MADLPPIRIHQDPVLFREAINYTTADTGFAPRLIEKDYFCSVVLQHLAGTPGLAFRGGTCLAKVFAGFYRLSEDLDFAISMPSDASRAERRQRVGGTKLAVARISKHVPGLHLVSPLAGARECTQYDGMVGYLSLVADQEETIKIEVALREPMLAPAMEGAAQTLLIDPLSGLPLVPPLTVTCLSRDEAFAEKLRAALTRREVAIRDYYDVDYLVRRLGQSMTTPRVVALVREKLAVTATDPVDMSPDRYATLRLQVRSQLKAVLRERDYSEFDLDRAFATVADVARAV